VLVGHGGWALLMLWGKSRNLRLWSMTERRS
jgi:hypothetical protein